MNTPFLSPLPKKLTLFGDPELNKPFCLPCKGRWVQLIAHGGIGKTARTSSPCRFWRFPSFARGQYPRTAPARKIRNLSHFLEVSPACRNLLLDFFYTLNNINIYNLIIIIHLTFLIISCNIIIYYL